MLNKVIPKVQTSIAFMSSRVAVVIFPKVFQEPYTVWFCPALNVGCLRVNYRGSLKQPRATVSLQAALC